MFHVVFHRARALQQRAVHCMCVATYTGHAVTSIGVRNHVGLSLPSLAACCLSASCAQLPCAGLPPLGYRITAGSSSDFVGDEASRSARFLVMASCGVYVYMKMAWSGSERAAGGIV